MSLGHIHITPLFKQAVRDAVDIVSVAEDHTSLKRRGDRYVGLCPLHKEKTPSFTVDPVQGLFYCFGCSEGGDAIRLHMMLSGDDFPAALESLARRFGVPVPTASRGAGRGERRERDLEGVLEAALDFFRRGLESSRLASGYLEKRRIPPRLVEAFEIGYAPASWEALTEELGARLPLDDLVAAGLVSPSEREPGRYYDRFRNRLVFPIRTAAGRLVGFGGRTLGDDKAKYVNTPETERFRKKSLLYGLDKARRAIRDRGEAFLAEGYFDVLAAVAAGIEGAVASMGTALTDEQCRLLARYADDVVVGYDGDDAGEQAYRKALPTLLAQGLGVRRARFSAGADPDTVRLEAGEEALAELVAAAPDAVELELDALVPAAADRPPHERARLAEPVAELLAAIRDPIVRYSYGRRAAERLGLPFDLLSRSIGRGGRDRPSPPAAPAEAEKRTPGQGLERGVLTRLLTRIEAVEHGAEPPALPAVDALPPAEVFWDPECRNIWTVFCDLYRDADGVPPSLGVIRGRLEVGGPAVDLLARLLIEGADAPRNGSGAANGREGLEEALESLRRRWLDQRLKELSREINEAQRAGDSARLQHLIEEKSELSRRVHLGAP